MKFLISLLLMTSVAFGDAVIFSGNDVKTLKQNIDLFGVAKILSGTVNPSAGAGVAAPQGSIYLSTTVGLYEKTGAPNTAWTKYQLKPVNLATDVTGILGVANGGTGLDGSTAANGSLLIGNGTGYTLATVTGTANQVNVTNGSGSITLSTPQDIATTSSPQFDDLTIDGDITLTGAQFNNSEVGHAIAYNASTGISGGSILSVASGTQVGITARNMHFSIYTTLTNMENPVIKDVNCPIQTYTVINLASTSVWLVSDDTCGIIELTSAPTPVQRRTYAFIGKVLNVGGAVNSVSSIPDIVVDTNSQYYDFLDALGAFNVSGNRIAGNAGTLSFARSSGVIWRRSANYPNDVQNPHQTVTSAQVTQTFIRLTQNSAPGAGVTTLDVGNYDNAGTITAIGGGVNQSTNQRVYMFASGLVVVQYGQQTYSTLAGAIAGISQESFILNPNLTDGGVLIAVISCTKGATDITIAGQCNITYTGRFDPTGVGAGSNATTNLQQAYNNSSQPQTVLTSALGGMQVRDALTPIGASLFAIQNNAGSTSYLGVDVNGISATNFVGSGTVGAVRVHNLTTTQKNALTPAAGMIVYDTTLSRMECYDGAWKACSSELTTKGDLATYSTTDTRLPVGANTQILQANSATTTGLEWVNNPAAPDAAYDLTNLGVSASVAANALTITLTDKSGATPSGSSPVKIGFRNATNTTGNYTVASATSATTMVVSAGSTLGTVNSVGFGEYIYIYAINNAGTIELAVSRGRYQDEIFLVNTSAEGGAGGADSSNAVYSTTARSTVPARLIGKMFFSSISTAGNWTALPEISPYPFKNESITTLSNDRRAVVAFRFGGSTTFTACTTATCTLYDADAGILDVTRSSTGTYAFNFYPGVFTREPVCTFLALDLNRTATKPSAGSATVYNIVTRNVGTTPAVSDAQADVICYGP